MTTLTFRVASAMLAITTIPTVATVSLPDAQGAGPKAGNAKKLLVKSNKQLPPRGAGNIQAALAMGSMKSPILHRLTADI